MTPLPPYTPSDPTARPQIRQATVTVDCAAPIGPLDRIWTSFGYDEINWTYTPAGKRNLRVIGELAEQPYFVRPHYVFNSGIGWSLPHWGAGNVYHEDEHGTPYYDFDRRRSDLRCHHRSRAQAPRRAGVHPARPRAR